MYNEAVAQKCLARYKKEMDCMEIFDIDVFVEFVLKIQLEFREPSDMNNDYAVNVFYHSLNAPCDCNTVGVNGFGKSILIDTIIAETDEALYRWILANAAANSVLYEEFPNNVLIFECTNGDTIHLDKSYCLDLRCCNSPVNTLKHHANMLAAAFLMPLSSVVYFLEERSSLFTDTRSLVYEMADCFCVPLQVAAYRLLNIFDIYGVAFKKVKQEVSL